MIELSTFLRGTGPDDLPNAFDQALAQIGERVPIDPLDPSSARRRHREGRTLRLPEGRHLCGRPLVIPRGIVLVGETGTEETPGTCLVFPSGTDGIIVQGRAHAAGGDGVGTVLRDFGMEGSYSGGGIGVRLEAHAKLENLSVRRFGSTGIHIEGGETPVTGWRLDWVSVSECRDHGLFLTRARHGLAVSCTFRNCGRYGIYDVSEEEGNLYQLCGMLGNGQGAFTNPSERSERLRCWDDAGPSDTRQAAMLRALSDLSQEIQTLKEQLNPAKAAKKAAAA